MKKFILSCLLAIPGLAIATPINITAQLTGDVRQASGANPTNLAVDVTITSDTTSNIASWVVDLNSTTHPDIKLDEFYFNMFDVANKFDCGASCMNSNDGNVWFDNFTPTGWEINSPASVQGAGGTAFQFETLDPSGPPNAADVTNSVNLTFDMHLINGFFTEDDFLDAIFANSNDAGSGQLGAHLQSLTTDTTNCPNGCNTDSGFAFGSYVGGGTPPTAIPEPVTTALFSLGLMGLLAARRRPI